MHAAGTMCLAGLTGLSLLAGGCASGSPPTVVDESERVTTLGVDIQDIEFFARELAQEMIAAGVLGEGDGPSDVLLREYINNTSEPGITRNRVVFPIMTTLSRSQVARPFDVTDPDVQNRIDEARFEGEELGDLYDYTMKVRLFEDAPPPGSRTRQVSYIIQLELLDITTGEGIPRSAWLDQRTITKQARRGSVGL